MSNPLSEQDSRLLTLAGQLHRPLVRAAKIAVSNGTWLAIFGALTILIEIFEPDYAALLLGGCVLWVGLAERRAGVRMRNADPTAPKLLARNELILMGAIVLYGVLKLTLLRSNSDELVKTLGDSLPDLDVQGLMNTATTIVNLAMIAVAIVYQGGMALYYSRKVQDIERFHAEIPEWARKLASQMS